MNYDLSQTINDNVLWMENILVVDGIITEDAIHDENRITPISQGGEDGTSFSLFINYSTSGTTVDAYRNSNVFQQRSIRDFFKSI